MNITPNSSFVTSDEIEREIKDHKELEKQQARFVHADEIFRRIRRQVTVGDRVRHLEALTKLSDESLYGVAKAILEAIAEWREGSLSVERWCRERLPTVVVELFTEFAYYLPFEREPLTSVLNLWASESQIARRVVLDGIERNVERLGAGQLYELVRIVVPYIEPADAAHLLDWKLGESLDKIPFSERDSLDLGELPSGSANAVARFLFALMSDVDVRTRWRAAHACRRLAEFGDSECIDALFKLYPRQKENTFRAVDSPFYWMAARLWFLMAVDRIALDNSGIVAKYGQQLFKVATDQSFAHVLIRSFAKDAVLKLCEQKCVRLKPAEQRMLDTVDTNHTGRKSRTRVLESGGIRGVKRQSRFHFDALDTLPHWLRQNAPSPRF